VRNAVSVFMVTIVCLQAMVRIREEQLVREYSEQEKQLQEVVESFKDKLSQSESRVVTLTAGRHGNSGVLYPPYHLIHCSPGKYSSRIV